MDDRQLTSTFTSLAELKAIAEESPQIHTRQLEFLVIKASKMNWRVHQNPDLGAHKTYFEAQSYLGKVCDRALQNPKATNLRDSDFDFKYQLALLLGQINRKEEAVVLIDNATHHFTKTKRQQARDALRTEIFMLMDLQAHDPEKRFGDKAVNEARRLYAETRTRFDYSLIWRAKQSRQHPRHDLMEELPRIMADDQKLIMG